MDIKRRYYTFNIWSKTYFNHPMHKICLDGSFTCPNRDGKVGHGGCTFCGERGAGEHVNIAQSVKEQAKSQLNHYLKRGEKGGFIAYFQNFTSTYAPPKKLKEIYDEALISKKIEALVIATRPDEINLDVVNLLKEYSMKFKVWVELGLQTSNDLTALKINRCYKREVFEEVVKLLYENDIDIVVHIIAGLPGETKEDFKNTILYLNNFPIKGIKIHSLYVMKNTKLEEDYRNGLYKPLELDEYIDMAVWAISHLREDIVIHRLASECMKSILVAPDYGIDKSTILNMINDKLIKLNISQGDNEYDF